MLAFSCKALVLTAALLAFNLLLSGQALAQSLQISPISIEMQPGQMATTLMVTNKGASASTLQIRPFQWSQSNGADQLTPTDQLLVSPPLTEIAPGDTQIFRLVMRSPAARVETSYRILLDQLPQPAAAGAVSIALRFSIPIFSEPDDPARSQINWRIDNAPGGFVLVGVNQGNQHIRILNPVLKTSGGQKIILKPTGSPYILPGARNTWPIATKTHFIPGTTLHLLATSDTGPINVTVHVSAS